MNDMLFGSATTTADEVKEVIPELVAQIRASLPTQPIHFVQIFMSPHFRLVAGEIAAGLRTALEPELLIGCTGESVIGRDQEIEQRSAITLIAAHLPGVELVPFTLQSMRWERFLDQADTFRGTIKAPAETKLFTVLGDPFTTPMDRVLEAFNTFYPDLPIIGGLASGSYRPGGNALLLNDQVLKNGAVGVAFAGAFEVDVIVSQGCRPIGQPMTVTEVQENAIIELAGKTPLEQLQALVEGMSMADQSLLQNGLFIGRAITPNQETLGRGDFLVRGVMGLDRQSGAMIVGDYLDIGETVQFHVRDANTAEEDLEMMLTPQLLFEPPAGALLFSCNGRGTRLYNHPDGDLSTIKKVFGQVDLAGFFCAGEIGPVGGKNFLHGHTASLALFRPVTEI